VTTASNPLGPNSLTNGTNSINPVTLSFNGSAYTTGATGINELYSAITGYNQNSNG